MTVSVTPAASTPVSVAPVGIADFSGQGTFVTEATGLAIQEAIDSATAPGIVQLAAGTYTVTVGLVMKDGVHVLGQGEGATVLNYTGSGDAVSWSYGSGPNIVQSSLRRLTISGSGNAGISITRAGLIQIEDVRIVGAFTYGFYGNFAEQNRVTNLYIDGCTTGVFLTGVSTGAASNFNKFEKCFITSCPTGIRLNANCYRNVFDSTPIYNATTAAVYIPAAAAAVWGNEFRSCWFEANTINNDLRGGSGSLYSACLVGSGDFVTVANFGHTQLKVTDLIDLSGNAHSGGASLDFELQGLGVGSDTASQMQLGSGRAFSRDSSHIRNLVSQGGAGTRLGLQGWGSGAGEKNLITSVDLTTWIGTAPTGGQTDPLNGTGAYSLASGTSIFKILSNANGGSALTGATFTFQVLAKIAAGGSCTIQLYDGVNAGTLGGKQFFSSSTLYAVLAFTYTFPTGSTGLDLWTFINANAAAVTAYWPCCYKQAYLGPFLPASRDMSAWVGPYEVFGPNHNVRVYVNNAAPASGTWAVGDEAVNYAPAAAGTDRWRCTTAGTSGTWKGVAVAA